MQKQGFYKPNFSIVLYWCTFRIFTTIGKKSVNPEVIPLTKNVILAFSLWFLELASDVDIRSIVSFHFIINVLHSISLLKCKFSHFFIFKIWCLIIFSKKNAKIILGSKLYLVVSHLHFGMKIGDCIDIDADFKSIIYSMHDTDWK